MANNGKKTRFFVRVNGVEREILSVQQRADKSLTLISGTPSFWENPDGSLSAFDQQHYSVHRTKNGRDTTITQKTWLRNGTHHSYVAYVHGTEEYLLWPLYARRIPILNNQTRILKRRAKDVLIEVPEFEWENASLLFSVFVAKAKFDSGLISPLRPAIAQFEEFQIILLPVFLNLRSLPTGDVVVVSTSSPVINGVKSEEHVQYYSESLPIGEFINFHFNCLGRLRDKMLERTQNLLGMRYSELAYTIENPPSYTFEPSRRTRFRYNEKFNSLSMVGDPSDPMPQPVSATR